MSWTDERVETLKRMWVEGQSASQIAKELGSVTRNAVIGKVHRLGLSNRAAPKDGAQTEASASATKPSAKPSAPPTVSAAVKPAAKPAPQKASAPPPPRPSPEVPKKAVVIEPKVTPAPAQQPDARMVASSNTLPLRKPILTPGQPLPPQRSLHEIQPEALATVREVEKSAKRLSLMELTERTCKWPIGDPATPEFWFCGLPSEQGKPYCEAHIGVAFQPMSARRDRRR